MTRRLTLFFAISSVSVAAVLGVALIRHDAAVADSDARWRAHRPAPLKDIGTTKSLTILPLLDWHTARDDLRTDVGVAYLVKTDDMMILFDVGNNSAEERPSPLEHNMAALDVELNDIDTIVISHAHFDHVGGKRWTDGAISGTTFGIGDAQPDLSAKRVVIPTAMTYPGVVPTLGTDPLALGRGVATTGTIPRKLLIGPIGEQALVIDVEGKGLVIIVGCGHQTLPRLIERVESVFDSPIYGIVGGLHYPVPDGRITKVGFNLQRFAASGDGPLEPITADQIDDELRLLEERDLGVVGIGGHDSSDAVIADVARRFGAAAVRVEVGRPITID